MLSMGNSIISMAIFNSKLFVYERVYPIECDHHLSPSNIGINDYHTPNSDQISYQVCYYIDIPDLFTEFPFH